LRRTALIYLRDGSRYVVVASGAGEDHHPAWYLNLRADPEVGVQVRDEVFLARATPATGAERERLWRAMATMWPDYEKYARRTARTIPVVLLTPR
jgi:deazaflavin-dependent oxidoreductase (nitroreductase family)